MFTDLPTNIIEFVASSLNTSTFSLSIVCGKSFFDMLCAFINTSFTLEFFKRTTTERFSPLFSTALITFEIERSVLGFAVIAKTLFSLNEITLAFLCKRGFIFARITAAFDVLSGNITVFIVSPSMVLLTSSPSPAALALFTTL